MNKDVPVWLEQVDRFHDVAANIKKKHELGIRHIILFVEPVPTPSRTNL